MQQIFGNIKKLRELRNLTQKYMAEQLKMTQANYSKIESGEIDLPYSRIEQIAKVLKINPENLISYDERKVFNAYFDRFEGAKITQAGDIIDNKVFVEEISKQYEARLIEKDKEIKRLHTLLEKALTK